MRFTRKKSDGTGNHRYVRFFSSVLAGTILAYMISACSANGQPIEQSGGNNRNDPVDTNTQVSDGQSAPNSTPNPVPNSTPDSNSTPNSTPAPATNPPEAPASDIGMEAAQNAALSHAGVSSEEASRMKCEFDMDHGTAIYEVEFDVGQTEYEYEIDAATGAILKSEIDYHDHHD